LDRFCRRTCGATPSERAGVRASKRASDGVLLLVIDGPETGAISIRDAGGD